MDVHTDWRVKIVQEDALLFRLESDGTVTMRAVPRKQWEELLAGNMLGGSAVSEGNPGARTERLSDIASETSAGITRYFEAARS